MQVVGGPGGELVDVFEVESGARGGGLELRCQEPAKAVGIVVKCDGAGGSVASAAVGFAAEGKEVGSGVGEPDNTGEYGRA